MNRAVHPEVKKQSRFCGRNIFPVVCEGAQISEDGGEHTKKNGVGKDFVQWNRRALYLVHGGCPAPGVGRRMVGDVTLWWESIEVNLQVVTHSSG